MTHKFEKKAYSVPEIRIVSMIAHEHITSELFSDKNNDEPVLFSSKSGSWWGDWV